MIPANETFDGTFPFEPNFFEGRGFKMHYVDEGEGDVILCLHGQPTWGYLYRNFIPPLSKTHRVIVPDHKGYGKSETPQDSVYSFQNHVENLAALIDHLSLEDITFVCQDWGGPITGAYTLRYPDKVKRICMMNTMMGYGFAVKDVPPADSKPPSLQSSSWFQWVVKANEEGYYRDTMGRLGEHVLSNMKKLYFHNSAAVDKEWLRAYSMPFPNKEACKAAIEFPLDAAYGRIRDYVVEGLKMGNLDKLRSKPAMLAEGMLDQAMPPAMVIDDFKRLFPRGPVVELEHAGHFCQEDVPETLVALIQQFIQMTE
ncbi:MAG: alpha/beta fold hydrolase [Bacteroidia bacterium]|nr:alpha/beta fold hydrolase [Bacteroidia bacterium]